MILFSDNFRGIRYAAWFFLTLMSGWLGCAGLATNWKRFLVLSISSARSLRGRSPTAMAAKAVARPSIGC